MRHYNTSNKILKKLQVMRSELEQLIDPESEYKLTETECALLSDALEKVNSARTVVSITPYTREKKS